MVTLADSEDPAFSALFFELLVLSANVSLDKTYFFFNLKLLARVKAFFNCIFSKGL